MDLNGTAPEDRKLIVDNKELERELIKISGKKSNETEAQTAPKTIPEEIPESHELSFEKLLAFSENMNIKNIKEFEEIKLRISKDKDAFNEFLEARFQSALKSNDLNEQINLLKIASMLPIGKSQLVNDVESIIINSVDGHKALNATLLKAAINFYFIQLQYFNEDINRKKRELLDNCKDDKTKRMLLNEFKNFKPSKGKVYESN